MKKYLLILSMILALLGSCSKENETDIIKPVTALLTQQPWILSAHGFDDNNNNVLDTAENLIEACQQDNSYAFRTDGTGSARDNSLVCAVPFNHDFKWQLLNNDTVLEINFEKLSIGKLNEQELILNPQMPGLAVRYLLVYRH